MAAIEDARRRYVAEFQKFTLAAPVIKNYLFEVAKCAGVHAVIDAREKTISSFIKKLHLKGDGYGDNPWVGVTDKLGARMTVESLGDLEKVRHVFEDPDQCPVRVLSIEDKSEKADEWLLFYPGVHIQVIVPNCTTSDSEQIECEVQLRTKAQDLWSVPSHKLVYKPIVDPSRQTKRQIMRLSVLVEIFDEEVEQAMRDVAELPGYVEARLLIDAESHYFTFASERGDRDLSFDVLRELSRVIQEAEYSDYSAVLRAFVISKREKLTQAFDDFGPHTEFANEWGYWLVSQPESIIVWQLIDHQPMLLANEIRGSDLEEAIRQLYRIWGSGFPE